MARREKRPPSLTLQGRKLPERERLAARLRAAIDRMEWPIMLTLTRVASEASPPPERLRATMRAFARLRRMRAFRPVTGGVAALELSIDRGQWNDHIHAIINAAWLDIRPLADAWSRALGGAGAVHVQRIENRPGALDYITKPPRVAYIAAQFDQAQRKMDQLTAVMSQPYLTTAWGDCRTPTKINENCNIIK